MHDGTLQVSSDCALNVAIDQQMLNRTRGMDKCMVGLVQESSDFALNVAIDQQMINRTRVMINA